MAGEGKVPAIGDASKNQQVAMNPINTVSDATREKKLQKRLQKKQNLKEDIDTADIIVNEIPEDPSDIQHYEGKDAENLNAISADAKRANRCQKKNKKRREKRRLKKLQEEIDARENKLQEENEAREKKLQRRKRSIKQYVDSADIIYDMLRKIADNPERRQCFEGVSEYAEILNSVSAGELTREMLHDQHVNNVLKLGIPEDLVTQSLVNDEECSEEPIESCSGQSCYCMHPDWKWRSDETSEEEM